MFRTVLRIPRFSVSVSPLGRLCACCLYTFAATVLFVAPPSMARADTADLYTGSGMVLQLARERGNSSEMKGVLYSREAAYKFEVRRRGTTFRSTELYARNDRLAPYRSVEGSVELQFRDGDHKVILDMSSPLRSLSAVFRRQLDARAYNLMSQYGDTYCDLNHLVLLVVDRPGNASGGWLSRVMSEDSELMPVIGFFFGPRVWYSFQAEGDPTNGITSASLEIGDGALEGYLGSATVKARLDASRLIYTYSDAAGANAYQFTYRSHDKLCARVVTRWTTRRRMPRGRVATETEPSPPKRPEPPEAPTTVKPAEEKPSEIVEPEKPKPVEEGPAVAPVEAGPPSTPDAPVEAPSTTIPKEADVPRAPAEGEFAAPEPAAKPPLKEERQDLLPQEELRREDMRTDIPGQEPLPEEYEVLPEEAYPYPEEVYPYPEETYPYPEEVYPYPEEDYPSYPEGDLYQPLPGEEYPQDPLYNAPLEEQPPGEFYEPAQ